MNIEMLGALLSISPVLLVGDAGLYKTRLAIDYAKQSDLEYEIISMTGDKMTSDLIGFVDLKGKSIPTTKILRLVENGGILILDEISLANPSILSSLNLLLGSNVLTLGSRMIEAHEDFKVIATANSISGDKRFVTNIRMDYAFIDRFFVYKVQGPLYFDSEDFNILLRNEIGEINDLLISLGYAEVKPSKRQLHRALKIKREIDDPELVLKSLIDPFLDYNENLYYKISMACKKKSLDINSKIGFSEIDEDAPRSEDEKQKRTYEA